VRIATMALLLGTAAAFSPAGLPHVARARAGTTAQAISMLSVQSLRGTSPMTALRPVSERKASRVALQQMPNIVNKWADPNWDPTKDEISTKVPLHIAAFKGNVEEVRPSSQRFSLPMPPPVDRYTPLRPGSCRTCRCAARSHRQTPPTPLSPRRLTPGDARR